MHPLNRILIIITAFSIAMGFLESAVVVYIREIMYPDGFAFPLASPGKTIIVTELIREAATMVMLLCVGILTGRKASERFAWFIYSFAVWDIFYYVFLRLLIAWPESLMTLDVLFFIPVTWVGPVLTPVLVSLTMIFFALLILRFSYQKGSARISSLQWILLISGSLILILAFTWDYSGYILREYSFSDIWSVPGEEMSRTVSEYVPGRFNWFLFCLGEAVILTGILLFWWKHGARGKLGLIHLDIK